MEDANEFFDTLLSHIEERRIIPVVGPDLLTVPYRGQSLPLYRAVAMQFLERSDGHGDRIPVITSTFASELAGNACPDI